MNHFDVRRKKAVRRSGWITGLLAGLLFPIAGWAEGPPSAFEAEFDFFRNGKLIGSATVALEVDGNDWSMTSASRGTRGIAKLLGLRESSISRGTWNETGPVPLSYEQEIKIAVKKIRTAAQFDWEAGIVHSQHEDGQTDLPLEPGVVDPVSSGLTIRRGLPRGEQEWLLRTVDEDEIEEHRFQARPPENLDTALGCLEIRNVERIRHPNSSRYTRTFYAADLDWVPVLIEHGKRDGDHFESRIRSLSIEGREIQPRPGC